MRGRVKIYYRPDTESMGKGKIFKLAGYILGADRHYQGTNKNGEFSVCAIDGVTPDFASGDAVNKGNMQKYSKKTLVTLVFKYFLKARKLAHTCKKCAKVFCQSGKDFRTRIREMNYQMALANRNNLNCDYLGNNYHGCTAAGITIKGNIIKRFNIGDANVIFVRNDGTFVERPLPDTYTYSEDVRKEYIEQDPNFDGMVRDWNNNPYRALYRQTFINTSIDGASYGNMNGRPEADNHVYESEHRLNELTSRGATHAFVYTDGSREWINSPEKRQQVINGKYSKYDGPERTLVVVPLVDKGKRLHLIRH